MNSYSCNRCNRDSAGNHEATCPMSPMYILKQAQSYPQENAPCGYCGYMPNVSSRQHASSCPTHEIEDLERRLTEFEQRIFQLAQENATMRELVSEAITDNYVSLYWLERAKKVVEK